MPQATIDVSTALDQRVNNRLSYEQIAKLQGVTKQAIHKRLKGLLPDEAAEVYREKRADIFSKMQLDCLSAVDGPKRKAASALQLVTCAGILYDKERLERGQSTSNIDTRSITLHVEALDADIARLERARAARMGAVMGAADV